ncbi:MAG: asparagine synthase-related protein [Phycisphaerae bacterium]|nr:asparagine synthase-related protein [Phycisphaerae bacterium]
MPFILAARPDDPERARRTADAAAEPLRSAGAVITRRIEFPGGACIACGWPAGEVAAAPANTASPAPSAAREASGTTSAPSAVRSTIAANHVPAVVARDARVHESSDLLVLLDGYVTDGPADPQAIAARFRQSGPEVLYGLDGSYVITVIEPASRRIHVLTDKGGSRPIFVAARDDAVLAAPELKCFAADPDLRGALSPAALLSLAINCYALDECTQWQAVRALGPARHVVMQPGRVSMSRYWSPSFGTSGGASGALDPDLVTRAVSAHLQPFRAPAIGLSGGVDSRILLAIARRTNAPVTLVTWSYDDRDAPDGDFVVAARLAQRAGLPHRTVHLRWDALADEVEAIVHASDGLVGHLGAYADRQALGRQLGAVHDAILFGDQCYRGEERCRSLRAAIEGIGLTEIRGAVERMTRLIMQPDAADACIADYRARLDRLASEAGPHADPHDLHDRLYWQVRLPRLLTGPKSLWRRFIEPVSPLLAEAVIRAGAALPVEQRVHKRALRRLVADLAPDLDEIAYARISSRVKWKEIFRRDGRFQRYVVETLLDPLPVFDRWFNRAAIERLLRRAMTEAAGAVTTVAPARRLGLRQRALAAILAPAFRPPLILSLLSIKLWLKQASEGPGAPVDREARLPVIATA